MDTIETQHVLLALKPIWEKIPATASRLRGRIERILAWATTHGHRSGENPARWGGHLENLLRDNQKATKADGSKEKNHQPALPYGDAPAFMRDVQTLNGVAPRALEIAMLTACRTGEVVGAEWSEFNLDAALWTIPATRMKARREHVVPLSTRAIAVLRELKDKAPEGNHYVFPGVGGRGRLNEFSMLRTIRRLNETRKKGGLPKWVDPKQGGARDRASWPA